MLITPGFFNLPQIILFSRLIERRKKDENLNEPNSTESSEAPLVVLRLWSECEKRRSLSLELPQNMLSAVCNWRGDDQALDTMLQEAKIITRDGEKVVVNELDAAFKWLLRSWTNGRLSQGRPRKDRNLMKPNDPLGSLSPPSGRSRFALSSDLNKIPLTPLEGGVQKIISEVFGRSGGNHWSEAEIAALHLVCARPQVEQEAEEIAASYRAMAEGDKGRDFRRTTVQRLLTHWIGELDRSRIMRAGQSEEELPPLLGADDQ